MTPKGDITQRSSFMKCTLNKCTKPYSDTDIPALVLKMLFTRVTNDLIESGFTLVTHYNRKLKER